MLPAVHVPTLAARRFALAALGLETPFPSISAALDHLGYVQIDPLNICGRMHDLILRNRVAGYREGDLMRHLHGGTDGDDEAPATAPDTPQDGPGRRKGLLPADARIAFEHHHPETHILVAFPFEAWPHLRGAMRARSKTTSAWSGRLTPTERKLAPQLLAEIRERGPLSSEDFADARRAHRVVWGAASLVKSTLQKLFFHGDLLIADRVANRRRYDLPEHVLPAHVLAQPEAPAAETTRWLAQLTLRQRRLARLRKTELAAVAELVQPVNVEGGATLYCLAADAPLLERCRREPTGADASARLLAPLDPLIYDRQVTAKLWNFDYTWEAYTPPAKRVRGHYALPVLVGTELVGHVEPKADRTRGKLVIASRSIARGYRVGGALDDLAAWLRLKR